MTDIAPVLVRIALRYGSAALIAFGIMSPEAADTVALDPDIALVLGLLIGAAVEGWYAWVRRHGGAT